MKIQIEKIIELVLKDADQRAEDAGFGGRMDDGGASRLRDQVAFYKAGMNNILPNEWLKYEEKLDPEYSEYIRLKNKFEK